MAIHMPSSLASSLNPNAPLFIPSSYYKHVDVDADAYGDGDGDDGFTSDWDEIEDFSPEWWNLVHISPYFCEYWLQNYEASGADEDLVILSLQDEDSSIDVVDVDVDDLVDDIVVKS